MRMFSFGMHVTWGLGLVLAALVLGNKASSPLPWATAVLGIVVTSGAFFWRVVDEREQHRVAEHASSDR
ncbi:hypothetical protein V6K52_13775 [Knoellia sp. S7-12]|uniref:hypothetical protein n=1 Tax=Knoellia sp. S7-12 TaxID=3126698 RepID=UPI00336977E4